MRLKEQVKYSVDTESTSSTAKSNNALDSAKLTSQQVVTMMVDSGAELARLAAFFSWWWIIL
ncbi:WSSV547 [White spot syndrome virus]|uniref:WSSV547 n=1 Tax=White spot syndrome virus TaxID=342409 RepID=A0A2I6SCJ2_9VIRU|nr:WSSV547 [White spot syndrome virus]